MAQMNIANPSIYPGGFATGLVVRGMPISVTHPGVVWWVSNNATLPGGVSTQRIPLVNGSDGNKGYHHGQTWSCGIGCCCWRYQV